MSIKNRTASMFEEMRVPYGGSFRPVARAVCRNCGAVDEMSLRAKSSLMPLTLVAKKFAEKGWTVGSNKDWHLCPSCSLKKPPKLALVKTENAMKEDIARPMTREEKRIVYSKLNEVYADEKQGYTEGWSDYRVATDLGVPRVWVEQVREEMFGPVAVNPEIDRFLKLEEELKSLRNDVTTLSALKGQLISVETGLKRVDPTRLIDRLNTIDKLAAEVRKHIPGLK